MTEDAPSREQYGCGSYGMKVMVMKREDTTAQPRWGVQPTGTIRLLTVPEAAKRLSVSQPKAWDLVSRGELDSLKIDASRRIPEPAVDEFIIRKLAEDQARRAGPSAA
jgi:excisionase family DNA binding protein